jgi:molybdopterin-guanine dinucleotide biosynthesis protein A
MHPAFPTAGVILAGGLARRMGGRDKPLLTLGGRTLLEHVTTRLTPQCRSVILNANGDPSRFGKMGLPVVPDSVDDHPGPLAGILTGLEWTVAHLPDIEWIVSVPGDTPFIPEDLVQRLHETRQESGCALACASSGGQVHFAVGLWPVALRHNLRHAIMHKGIRSIREWVALHGCAETSWRGDPVDPFFNINTPEDLNRAEDQAQREEAR